MIKNGQCHKSCNEINIKFTGKIFCTSSPFILGNVLFYQQKEDYRRMPGDGVLFRLTLNFMGVISGKWSISLQHMPWSSTFLKSNSFGTCPRIDFLLRELQSLELISLFPVQKCDILKGIPLKTFKMYIGYIPIVTCYFTRFHSKWIFSY